MEFGAWILDAIERVGFPIAISVIGSLLLFFVLKQSSKRDSDNSKLHANNLKLHEANVKVQERQTEILDKLANNMREDNNGVKVAINTTAEKLEKVVSDAKNEIVELVKDNHKVTINTREHVENLVKSLEQLPVIIKDGQTTYNEKVETGLQSIITEFKNLFSSIKSEDKTNETSKGTIAINPNFHGVDG